MGIYVGSSDATQVAAVRKIVRRLPSLAGTIVRRHGELVPLDGRMTSIPALLEQASAAARRGLEARGAKIGVGFATGVVSFEGAASWWADRCVCRVICTRDDARVGTGWSAPVDVPGDVLHAMTFYSDTLREAFARTGRSIDGAITDGSLIATLTPDLMPRQARLEQAAALAFLSFLQQPL